MMVAPFEYETAIPYVSSIFPTLVPAGTYTPVFVVGGSVVRGDMLYCRFGSASHTEAGHITSTLVRCAADNLLPGQYSVDIACQTRIISEGLK